MCQIFAFLKKSDQETFNLSISKGIGYDFVTPPTFYTTGKIYMFCCNISINNNYIVSYDMNISG